MKMYAISTHDALTYIITKEQTSHNYKILLRLLPFIYHEILHYSCVCVYR